MPELHFNANAFADVVEFLRDVTGANIYVDWPALERASISRDAPVTACWSAVSARTASIPSAMPVFMSYTPGPHRRPF